MPTSRRPRWSGWTTRRRPTGRAGRRSAPARTTSTATTRCSRPGSRPRTTRSAGRRRTSASRCRPRSTRGGEGSAEADEDLLNAMASEAEVLRHRDIADMAAQEKARLSALFETSTRGRRDGPPTVVRRGTGGTSTPRRTLRQMLRRMGEPGEIQWRRRATRPRRVVLLIDVSGSMSAYADALLRLAHRFCHGRAVSTSRRRRGVHDRHPADPGHPRDADARPGAGDRGRR